MKQTPKPNVSPPTPVTRWSAEHDPGTRRAHAEPEWAAGARER